MDLITKGETQLLKGIAIIMVIIEHIGQAFHIGIINPLGPLGVFLFLFLSGYGLSCSYKKNGVKNYLSNKIIKVYLPYAFTVVLFLIWSLIINTTFSVTTIARYFVLLSLPQGSYWYLVLMFYWYIVFYLCSPIYKKIGILIAFMVVASLLITWLEGFSRGYVWQFISFPLGVVVGKYPDKTFKSCTLLKNNLGSWILLIVAVVLVVFKKTPYVELHELGIVDTALQIGITLILGVWLILNRSLFEKIRLLKVSIMFVGAYSYELYLSHVVMLDWLKNSATIIHLLIYIVIMIASAVLIYLFSKGIKYTWKKRLIADGGRI
ncbi:MAG: acyltransferase family protein [Clostridiaceae bacterium]